MERTRKQWHRYFVEEISSILNESIDNRDNVFVECGVKQGSSSVRMGKRLNIPGYLFDTWHGFPNFSELDVNSDHARKKMRQRVKNGSNTYDDCVAALKKHGIYDKCYMFRGDILKTVPDIINNVDHMDGHFNIVMMHIDTDLYEPAKMSLGSFWDYVVDGGVVVFHDYGDKKWRGIKVVVDELVDSCDDLHFHVFDSEKLSFACIVKGSCGYSKDIFDRIVNLDR